MLLYLPRWLLFDFLYFLSSGELDSLDDESEELGSDSRSSGTYSFHTFSSHFDDSVSSVNVFGSDVFPPTVVESKGGIFASDVFVPT